jgi:hypothetical protein
MLDMWVPLSHPTTNAGGVYGVDDGGDKRGNDEGGLSTDIALAQ